MAPSLGVAAVLDCKAEVLYLADTVVVESTPSG